MILGGGNLTQQCIQDQYSFYKKGNKTKQEEGKENKCIDCGMELREMSRIPPKLMFSKGRKIINKNREG